MTPFGLYHPPPVIDFTKQRLLRMASRMGPQDKAHVLELITRYEKKEIAIAWDDGIPKFREVVNKPRRPTVRKKKEQAQ